jgi:hypothetical protein
MFLWYPVLDLARAPRRTARKKGSGYENGDKTAANEAQGFRSRRRSSPSTVFVSVGRVNNINKLSLVGMQQLEKYTENFDISSEGPSSGVASGVREIT